MLQNLTYGLILTIMCSFTSARMATDIYYFPTGSNAAVKLEELLLKPQLLKDVSQLSPKYQTSTLEAKHSLDIQFVPKHTAFSYWGMYTRFAFHIPANSLSRICRFPFFQRKLSVIMLLSLLYDFVCTLNLRVLFTIFPKTRLCLSALHYNDNADRMQAVTMDGRPRYSIVYPKAKKGEHAVRSIKTKSTYGRYRVGFPAHNKQMGKENYVWHSEIW